MDSYHPISKINKDNKEVFDTYINTSFNKGVNYSDYDINLLGSLGIHQNLNFHFWSHGNMYFTYGFSSYFGLYNNGIYLDTTVRSFTYISTPIARTNHQAVPLF